MDVIDAGCGGAVPGGSAAALRADAGVVQPCVVCTDGVKLPLTPLDLQLNVTLKNCIDDCADDDAAELPVPYNSDVMRKVLEFTAQNRKPMTVTEFEMWRMEPLPIQDADFVGSDIFFHRELLMAANFLDNKPLLDLCAKRMAERLMNKTPDDIKAMFNSQKTVTEADVAQVRVDYPWLATSH